MCQIAFDHAGDVRPLAEIVMGIARHDGEPGPGIFRRIVPARILHAAAKQRVELGYVFRRDGVVIGEQQQRRHGQLSDFRAPVIVLPHQLAHAVEEERELLRMGRHFGVTRVERRLLHLLGLRRTHGLHSLQNLRETSRRVRRPLK